MPFQSCAHNLSRYTSVDIASHEVLQPQPARKKKAQTFGHIVHESVLNTFCCLFCLPCLCLCAPQIRKLFNLTKDDDVRKYVNTYRRTFEVNGKKHSKAPKIQRLVSPHTPACVAAGMGGEGMAVCLCCCWDGRVVC